MPVLPNHPSCTDFFGYTPSRRQRKECNTDIMRRRLSERPRVVFRGRVLEGYPWQLEEHRHRTFCWNDAEKLEQIQRLLLIEGLESRGS